MANPYRIICGPGNALRPPRAWQSANELVLRIGDGRDDVHLQLGSLSRTLAAALPPVCADLLEIAAYIFGADQVITRGGTQSFDYGDRWRRHLRFEIPVREVNVWKSPDVIAALTECLCQLTDDHPYEFGFRSYRNPPRFEKYLFDPIDPTGRVDCEEVMLFSGGLDSLSGAVQEALIGRRRVALVSHRSANQIYSRQCDLVSAISARIPERRLRPVHIPVVVNTGPGLDGEFTQRTRSFLYVSAAAVVARAFGRTRVRFYENGITSLNLPLSPQFIGARASQTTHPRVLAGYERLLSVLFGNTFLVDNPFQWTTKTGVLRSLKGANCAHLCARAVSCTQTRHRTAEHPHCGRCSQCLDRRLAAIAAGLSDEHDPPGGYESNVLTGNLNEPDRLLAESYVRTTRKISRINDIGEFLCEYGEINRALRTLGLAPRDAAKQVFHLCRTHSAEVCNALSIAIGNQTATTIRQTYPYECLLTLACSAGAVALQQLQPKPPSAPTSDEVIVDLKRFSVRQGRHECPLGNKLEFRLFEYLHERMGDYVTIEELADEIWNDSQTRNNTIQRVVSNLRRLLRDSNISGVAVDGSQDGYYRLVITAD